MKIRLEAKRCKGTALCVALAPDVFAMKENGIPDLLVDEVPEALAHDAEEAVLVCPSLALTVVEDDDE